MCYLLVLNDTVHTRQVTLKNVSKDVGSEQRKTVREQTKKETECS